jgi:hypothetical protein
MKKLNFLLAGALAGCVTGWQKPGATSQDLQRDRYRCQMEAAATYPPNMVAGAIRQAPMTTNCRPAGFGQVQCTTMPGMVSQAPATDQNVIPRALAVTSCLQAAGWTSGGW